MKKSCLTCQYLGSKHDIIIEGYGGAGGEDSLNQKERDKIAKILSHKKRDEIAKMLSPCIWPPDEGETNPLRKIKCYKHVDIPGVYKSKRNCSLYRQYNTQYNSIEVFDAGYAAEQQKKETIFTRVIAIVGAITGIAGLIVSIITACIS
jgi:hypothetical protein